MQISKKRLKTSLKIEIETLLFRTIADLKNSDEVKQFLTDLLTETELEVFAKRLAIVYRLDKRESYDQIKKDLQTSSTTVAAMAEQMKNNGGFRLALGKVKADEWAEKWTLRIKKLFADNKADQ